MGRQTFSRTSYDQVRHSATSGGTTRATYSAEEKLHSGQGLDTQVDPKGFAHLGPVRMSLPRFEPRGELWELTVGLPMAIETLLDTTGSMGGNVELAFNVLPQDYAMLTEGKKPILGRYDVQIANAIFNDIQDDGTALLARSQFEMAEKIPVQLALLPPGRQGCANGKEDPQFGLFGAAYLTDASINRWGLKHYHFTVSDEPVDPYIDAGVVRSLFGDDVFKRIADLGKFNISPGDMPGTAQAIQDLQQSAHAFFLQVSDRPDVRAQWRELYGEDHFIRIGTTEQLHYFKAIIIGLTEGVLDLGSAADFLREHGLDEREAAEIVRAVAHIPLGAQTTAENFGRIPVAGDIFASKSDLWPINPAELDSTELAAVATSDSENNDPKWL